MTKLAKSAFVIWCAFHSLLSAGCVFATKSYIGHYEISCEKVDAQDQARSMATVLAHVFTRELSYVEDEEAGLQVILKDNRKVVPQLAVHIVVTYSYQEDSYSVTLRKGAPNEDEQVVFLRKKIEEILNQQGAIWSFRTASWSFAE